MTPWIDPGWLDFKEATEERRRQEYHRQYPTRWKRFLHWIGII
jgi:hypothetical protein